MDKVTIKDWQDMIPVRTQLFLNIQEYKICCDLFEEFKSKYDVTQSIRLSENALRNLKAGNKHIMNNPKRKQPIEYSHQRNLKEKKQGNDFY